MLMPWILEALRFAGPVGGGEDSIELNTSQSYFVLLRGGSQYKVTKGI